MGSIVVFSDQKEKNLLSLVDGQQRITTITIMLSIIRRLFSEHGETGSASGIHALIETNDIDDRKRFVLEHDPADRYFQFAIQSNTPDLKLTPEGSQQENLQGALRFLESALRNYLKTEIGGQTAKVVTYLRHLRECLLQMHFISIEIDDEDYAYLIFKILNTRGKDLRSSDLLKNHFMRLLPSKTKGMDYAKITWAEIIEKLNSVTASIDTDAFLLHYWLSTHSSVSKASLFSHYKSHIKKSNAKVSLDSIKASAATYVRCMAPTEVNWAKEQRSLRDSVQSLRIFGVAQAAPLMLAIMTQYERSVISLRSTKTAFELIENFTFQFNALTQSRGGGGVSNMYAKLAQTTMGCTTSQAFSQVISDMRGKFRERIPDELEFTIPFSRLIYRNDYTRDRNLVRYVLMKLSKHYGMPEEVDPAFLTIEHILPQSGSDFTDDEFDVGAIGNLIFVNEKINGEVGVKPFKEKLALFTARNNVYLDETLKTAKKWDYKAIANRGLNLAKVGYNDIWKL